MENKAIVHAILQAEDCKFMRLKMKVWIGAITFSVLLAGCKDEIHLANFDAQKWKDDSNGCNGSREKLLTALLAGQVQLIGHNSMEIKAFLGKPDSQDLRTRGLMLFEYGVKGGNLCNPQSLNQPEILRIRFDALDRVKEVAVY